MSDVIIREDERLSDTGNGEEIIAHIVKKSDWGTGYVEGKEITALCGVKWIPAANPDGKRVCEDCQIEVIRRKANG